MPGALMPGAHMPGALMPGALMPGAHPDHNRYGHCQRRLQQWQLVIRNATK
jgi:hypothetical protein